VIHAVITARHQEVRYGIKFPQKSIIFIQNKKKVKEKSPLPPRYKQSDPLKISLSSVDTQQFVVANLTFLLRVSMMSVLRELYLSAGGGFFR
jgi:hypothetical protein